MNRFVALIDGARVWVMGAVTVLVDGAACVCRVPAAQHEIADRLRAAGFAPEVNGELSVPFRSPEELAALREFLDSTGLVEFKN